MRAKKPAIVRREVMGGLAKGLEVIRAFTREQAALTLSEVAAVAGLPAATARRCLHTLEDLGYVMRSGRSFLLRPKVLELGAAYLESMNIEALTKTYLEDLAQPDRRLRGAHRARRHGNRVRGARVGAHAAAARGARRQPASRLCDFDGTRAARGLEPRTPDALFRAREVRGADRPHGDRSRQAQTTDRRMPLATATPRSRTSSPTAWSPSRCRSSTRPARVVAALNSSGHSKRISRAKLVRERLKMLQDVSRRISAELRGVSGLSLSAQR